jgi:hypothetical protein
MRTASLAASRRGILGGAVLLAIGLAFMVQAVGMPNAASYLFITLGLAFAAAWWTGTRQYVYLVPAGVLLGFGLGLVIPTWFGLAADTAAPIFLGTLAAGLMGVFLLAPERPLPLIIAGIIMLVTLVQLFLRIDLVPTVAQPYFVPVILIVLGGYLLVERRGH